MENSGQLDKIMLEQNPANICLIKFNKRCEICSKLTIKTLERRQLGTRLYIPVLDISKITRKTCEKFILLRKQSKVKNNGSFTFCKQQ